MTDLKKKIAILTLVFTLLPLLLLAIGILNSTVGSAPGSVAPGSAGFQPAPENSNLTYLIATMLYILTVIIISGFLNSPDLPKSIFSPHTPWQAGWRMALINSFTIFSFAYYIATGKIPFLAITAIAAIIAVMIIKSKIEYDDETEIEPD